MANISTIPVSLSKFAQETETFFRDFLDAFLLEFLAPRLLKTDDDDDDVYLI
jgi:hypothetical protein